MRRSGFTLIETIATLALLCFIVAVLGPLLVRASRQSSGVTMGQYRTAALSGAASERAAEPFDQLVTTCDTSIGGQFPHVTCTTVFDTLASLRRVRIVVTPSESLLTAPDTVVLYRVNSARVNPFNSP
jgi:prepilin-type N-terminal cleavage/methylation domain-containing protein